MYGSQFSPTKQGQQSMQIQSPEDFNKKLNQMIELNLISIKQHAMQAKKKLAVDESIKENIQKQMKKQINDYNHFMYNYLQEDNINILQYLIMGLYNVFITSDQRESLFQRFRILNDEPLKLQMQDKIIMERRLQEKNKIIDESKQIISQLQQKIDQFDTRIDQARMTISQNKRKEENLHQMQNSILSKDQYIKDIKQQHQIKMDELSREYENISQRLTILQTDRQQLEANLRSVKKANADLDLALKKSNLLCKQLSEKLFEIDDSHYQFMAKGQTILSSVFNQQDYSAASTYIGPQITQSQDYFMQEKLLQQQQQLELNQLNIETNEVINSSKIQSVGIATPQNPGDVRIKLNQVQQEYLQPQNSDLKDSIHLIKGNEEGEVLNYKFEFIKLSEFLLSMISLIQNNGGNLQIIPLKQMLDNKRNEIQAKYIVATTLQNNKLDSSQNMNMSPIFKPNSPDKAQFIINQAY